MDEPGTRSASAAAWQGALVGLGWVIAPRFGMPGLPSDGSPSPLAAMGAGILGLALAGWLTQVLSDRAGGAKLLLAGVALAGLAPGLVLGVETTRSAIAWTAFVTLVFACQATLAGLVGRALTSRDGLPRLLIAAIAAPLVFIATVFGAGLACSLLYTGGGPPMGLLFLMCVDVPCLASVALFGCAVLPLHGGVNARLAAVLCVLLALGGPAAWQLVSTAYTQPSLAGERADLRMVQDTVLGRPVSSWIERSRAGGRLSGERAFSVLVQLIEAHRGTPQLPSSLSFALEGRRSWKPGELSGLRVSPEVYRAALDAIGQVSLDDDLFVSERAVTVLAGTRDPRVVPILVKTLESTEHFYAPLKALTELGPMSAPAIPALVRFMDKHESGYENHLTAVLAGTGDARAVPPLVQAALRCWPEAERAGKIEPPLGQVVTSMGWQLQNVLVERHGPAWFSPPPPHPTVE